jgi:polysaccharide biosynthesis protein PelF
MRRALLVNWDSYPHITSGGVYTWEKGLVENLEGWEFIVFNQLSNPNANADFNVPPQVKKVIGLPIFGTLRVEEYYSNGDSLLSRISRTDQSVIRGTFAPLFSEFVRNVFSDRCEPDELSKLVFELHRFLVRYDFKKCFEDPRTWDVFLDEIRSDPLNSEMTLREALVNFQLIQRSLQVLSVDIPKVDLVHASLAWLPALVGISTKMEHGCPFVITEHGIAFRELMLYYNMFLYNEASKIFWTTFTRNVVRSIYASADMIVPVCRANESWEKHLGADPAKIRVIHNGVDTNRFRPIEVPRHSRPTVVTASRISVFKDLVAMIQAISIVRSTIPDVLCMVFGESTEPEYSATCLETVRRLGLEDNFRFMGGTKEPEKAYALADVVVFSSITEGFPFAVIEAMACGKPVVATDVGGVSEALSGCGILVRSRNPEALAGGIQKLLADESLRRNLGAKGLEKVRKDFSLKLSIQRYGQVYRELVSQADKADYRVAEEVLAK